MNVRTLGPTAPFEELPVGAFFVVNLPAARRYCMKVAGQDGSAEHAAVLTPGLGDDYRGMPGLVYAENYDIRECLHLPDADRARPRQHGAGNL